MLFKTSVLVFFLHTVLVASQGLLTISCNYRQYSPNHPYTCDLTLINPDGLDNFDRIDGEHLEGRTDGDVASVNAYNQNSVNVPSIICRQFPNLRDLYIASSNIEVINESAFSECRNMEAVMLSFNEFVDIPDNTFRNSENLMFVYLSNNRIQSINPNSFAGTRTQYLSLGGNFLSQVDPQWFAPISETVETLELVANDITSLPNRAFSSLENLIYLELTGNKLTNIPGDVFAGLSRLETLYLSDCELGQIDPEWFTDLRALDAVHFEFNELTNLPDGVFSPLTRLRRIFIGGNNLTEISAVPFGRAAANIEFIGVDNNPIRAIDRDFIVSARHLDTLGLYRASCHDSNIYNFHQNREASMQQLEKCFANFGPEVASCEYGSNADHDYFCELTIRNPTGRDFPSIDGDHLTDRSDSDVITVIAIFQSTQQIPQAICRQFTELRNLDIISSFIEVINEESLTNCRNLEYLELSHNEISVIADNTFVNNPNLRELFLGWNRIVRLNANSLAGTVIENLDLSNNRFVEFDPEWDRPIENTLQILELVNNNIFAVNADTFANLRRLGSLVLNGNGLSEIHDDAFLNLESLEFLELSRCRLTTLNPLWFRSLSNLRHISIGENLLTEFPENIFDSLTSLQEVYFFANRITELRASSFGASLPSLTYLYASNNMLNSVDPEIITRGTEITSLILYANLCTQLNFFDVRGDAELILQQLEACTSNFELETTLSCEYDRMITGRIYWCRLTMVNPLGRNDIDSIEGEHLPGGSDGSVMYISSEGQNTINIPSVICRQFESLEVLDLIQNGISDIAQQSFAECGFLRELMITGNRFTAVPSRTFAGAPRLQTLFMMSNGIKLLSPFSFSGTQIDILDLSHNEIGLFMPETFAEIGTTLRVLILTDNRLEQLPPNAFNALQNLAELELNGNHFFSLPANVFAQSINLRILQISNCGIERLQPNLFSNLTNLVDLELSLNEFDLLPENVFDLPTLQTLGLDGNNLRILDAASFGRSLGSLLSIDASLNRIQAFDPEVISESSNIRSLNLAYNLCVDLSFGDIPQFRDEVLRNLEACISTYNDVPISCEFTEDEAQYECGLTLDNEIDRLRFERIAGAHMEGHDDNFVTHVFAIDQNSRGIPSIICQQFRNIESFSFVQGTVEYITSNNFAACENMYSINLSGNRLLEIPDEVFIGNPFLSALTVASNRLNRLSPQIFDGSQIYYLDIENNLFREFDQNWLQPIATSLRYLILRNNQIQRFLPAAFTRFTNLFQLELSGNIDTFVPSSSFEGLTLLNDLEMGNCGLHNLNPHWFKDLRFLNRLEVDMNGIRDLPDGIFDLPYLRMLGIAFNRISVLDSRAFGSSINALVSLDAEENEITAIDRSIVENATGLLSLMLAGNSCSDSNFLDVSDRREEVLENLQGCFNNFESLVK